MHKCPYESVALLWIYYVLGYGGGREEEEEEDREGNDDERALVLRAGRGRIAARGDRSQR